MENRERLCPLGRWNWTRTFWSSSRISWRWGSDIGVSPMDWGETYWGTKGSGIFGDYFKTNSAQLRFRANHLRLDRSQVTKLIWMNQTTSKKLPPKVLVDHDTESLTLDTTLDCGVCKILPVDVSNSQLRYPRNSNQLAESKFLSLFVVKFNNATN